VAKLPATAVAKLPATAVAKLPATAVGAVAKPAANLGTAQVTVIIHHVTPPGGTATVVGFTITVSGHAPVTYPVPTTQQRTTFTPHSR
jgi:hypothetical protein